MSCEMIRRIDDLGVAAAFAKAAMMLDCDEVSASIEADGTGIALTHFHDRLILRPFLERTRALVDDRLKRVFTVLPSLETIEHVWQLAVA